MKTTSNKTVHVLLAVIAAAVALGAFVMFRHRHKVDYMEFFGIGYSDMISFVVQGYQCHWQNMSPESMDLSPVYAYESEFGAFIEYDIDGDGVGELLMGEQAEDGSYQIYDIFTFNRRNGETIQLFSGGERDWCTLGGNGIIIDQRQSGKTGADESLGAPTADATDANDKNVCRFQTAKVCFTEKRLGARKNLVFVHGFS